MLSYLFYTVAGFTMGVFGSSFRGSMLFLVVFHWMFYRTLFGVGSMTSDIEYDLYLPLGYVLATLAGCVLLWALQSGSPIAATRHIIKVVGIPSTVEDHFDVFRTIRMIVFMFMIIPALLIFELFSPDLIFPGILVMVVEIVIYIAIVWVGRVSAKKDTPDQDSDDIPSRPKGSDSPEPAGSLDDNPPAEDAGKPERKDAKQPLQATVSDRAEKLPGKASPTSTVAGYNIALKAMFYILSNKKGASGVKQFTYSDITMIIVIAALSHTIVSTAVFWALITWVPTFWQFYLAIIINGAYLFGSILIGFFTMNKFPSSTHKNARIDRNIPW